MKRVFLGLKIPDVAGPFQSGQTMRGESVFIVTVHRAATGNRYCDIVERFGGNQILWGLIPTIALPS